MEATFGDFVRLYTDGSVNLHDDTATATWYIPALEVNWTGLLNFQSSSTIAKLNATWVALQMLLKQPLPKKAIILTDSQCALKKHH